MSFVKDITQDKKAPITAIKKKEAADLLDKMHQADSRLVKGIFKNLECPGGTETFPFRMYPQDPVRMYTFEDGGTYEIPLCVARHINKTCNEKQHALVVDAQGKKTVDLVHGRQRFQFLSTDFM